MSNTQPDSDNFLQRLAEAQAQLDAGFSHLPPAPLPELGPEAAAILHEAATRMHDNYPYAHPLYAGQMLKPPHPIARAAYAMAMSINPNNHALDGGRASSSMELEAVVELAKMFGFVSSQEGKPGHLGHLSSSGTFANLEALWVSGQLLPGRGIAASDQAHYTHARISSVLGLPFTEIPSDSTGRMDLAALEHALQTQNIGTVVVTLGTTAVGAVDPLDQILLLQQKYDFRIHVDSAYGGYFTLAPNLAAAGRAAYDAIPHADSIVVDPHKHGLQPYGCGAVLFRDPSVGRFYKHGSPYTYFTSKNLHLGEISLECSRAGASAVALWATQQLFPYIRDGEFARNLGLSRQAALTLNQRLGSDSRFVTPIAPPQLDIVFWAVTASSAEKSSQLARDLFAEAAKLDLHLALATLPTRYFPARTWATNSSANSIDSVTCLRSVLMKPEHLEWLDQIWFRINQAVNVVVSVNTPFTSL